MASSAPRVRFVRCPKCHRVLTEFIHVAMYQCGGCGTTLRAKYHKSAGNVTVGSSSADHSRNPLDSSSSKGSTFSSDTPSSEVNHTEEQASTPDHCISFSSMGHDRQGKEELSESKGSESEDRRNRQSLIQSQLDKSMKTKSEYILDEELDQSLKPAQQNSDSGAVSHKMKDSGKSTDQSVASAGNMIDGEFRNGCADGLRSPITISSTAYDSSISCSDDGRNDAVPNKYRLLSRRTFRKKKVLDSVDINTKEGKSIFENNFATLDVEKKFQAKDLALELSNEKNTSAINRSLDSKRDEEDGGTSFASEDFQSAMNWMETEEDEPSRTQNDNPSTKFKYLEHNRLKLLKMVDELRDQLSGFGDRMVERKARYHYKGDCRSLRSYYSSRGNMPQMYHFSKLPLTAQPSCSYLHCLPPRPCCNNGLCKACPYSTFYHPAEPTGPRERVDSNISSCCYKAQIHDHDLEKMHSKDKKLTTKRHCRPLSGGAPFIMCYECLKLLQLPANFLVSRKRLHKLQCGACSKVLVLRFDSSAHSIPGTSVETVHPPSEIDNGADVAARGDPFSYTENYGLSFNNSYSTEAEPEPHVSRNSSEAMEETNGKKVIALHRLMGYSSATEILYQPSDISEAYESTGLDTYQPSEDSQVFYGLVGRKTWAS